METTTQRLGDPLIPDDDSAVDLELAEGGQVDEVEEGLPYQSSFCGVLWATWVHRGFLRTMLDLGPGEQVQVKHCYKLMDHYHPQRLYDDLVAVWHREVLAKGNRASVLIACAKVHCVELAACYLSILVLSFVSFGDPLFINLFINYAGDKDASMVYGVILAFGFLTSRLTYICIENTVMFRREMIGSRVRNALTGIVFRKALAMRQDALMRFSSGKLNNLVTTDVDRGRALLLYCDGLLTIPLRCAISMVTLHYFLGSAFWVGLAFMLAWGNLGQPIMYFSERRGTQAQKATDARVHLVGEMLKAIQVVKCYAWEDAAEQKVSTARQDEIKAMWRCKVLEMTMGAIMSSIIPFTMIVIFVTYTILNPERPLSPAATFTVVNLLETLRGVLWQIPWMVTSIIEARISAKRITDMLFLSELQGLPALAGIGGIDGVSPAGDGQPAQQKPASVCHSTKRREPGSSPRQRRLKHDVMRTCHITTRCHNFTEVSHHSPSQNTH